MNYFSDDWDKKEKWKSSKIWDYIRLLDVDRWFHTKHMWHRSLANIMFYMGVFHLVIIVNYYISLALYNALQGDMTFP